MPWIFLAGVITGVLGCIGAVIALSVLAPKFEDFQIKQSFEAKRKEPYVIPDDEMAIAHAFKPESEA